MKHLTNLGAIKKRRDSLRFKIRKDIEGLMALANPDGCLTFFEAAHAVLDSILISANTNPAPLSNYIADSYLEQTLKLGLSAQSNPKPAKPANLKPKATGYLKAYAEPDWLSMCPPSAPPTGPETVSMTDENGKPVIDLPLGGSVSTLVVKTLGVKAPPGYELVKNPAKDCYTLTKAAVATDDKVKISTKQHGYVYSVMSVGAYIPSTVVEAFQLIAEPGYTLEPSKNGIIYYVVKT